MSRGSDGTPPTRPDVTATTAASGVTETSGGPALAPAVEMPAARRAAEHYEIAGEIGRGGMGRILRGRDRKLGREVAIKELIRTSRDARRRFEREARITALLQHPAIVSVYEVVTEGDDEPYYTMRLVSGATLAERIAAASPAARRALVRHVLTVAEAMAYAHGQRIIHRDLKASNVIVGELGETVVIDWGLARQLAEDDAATPDAGPARFTAPGEDLTVVGAVLGTPAYMSPEQAAGEAIDARADVYAIGAMLYHTLSGVQPYDGRTSHEILARVVSGPPVPLAERVPDVPRDLAAIVARAMARAPAERYPSARELATDLDRYLSGQLVASHRYAPRELLVRWLRRHRAAVGVMAVALVAGTAGAAIAIRNVVAARDHATAAQRVAERERAEADLARREAVRNSDVAILASAQAEVTGNPRAALERLAKLSAGASQWSEARPVIADALARGVAFPLGEVADVGNAAVADDGTVLVAGAATLLRAGLDGAGVATPARLAAVASDGSAAAWAEGDQAVVEVAGTRQRVALPAGLVALAVAPGGGTLLAVAGDRAYQIDVATGARRDLGPVPDQGGPWRLAFSADGAYLTVARRMTALTVRRVDGRSGEPSGEIWAMATSADGRWLAYRNLDGVFVRDPAGGTRKIGDGGPWATLRFDPTGRWLAWHTMFDGDVHLWDLRAGKAHVLRAHTAAVNGIAFDATGTALASTADDATARIWDLGWLDAIGRPFEEAGPSGSAAVFDLGVAGRWVGFAPGGRLVVISQSGTVWRWLVPDLEQRRLAGGAVLSPDGRWLAELVADGVAVSPRPSGPRRVLRGVARFDEIWGGTALSAQTPMPVFAAQRPVLVAAGTDAVLRWDVERDAVERWPVPELPDVLAVSPDATMVATHAPGGDVLLLTATAPPRRIATIHEVVRLAFSADGRYLAACRLEARVFRVADGSALPLPPGTLCELSPAGDAVAIGGATTELALCTLADQRCQTLRDGRGAASIRIARAGGVVAELGAGVIASWQTPTSERRILGRHRDELVDLDVAADGRTVLSAGRGPELILWDVPSATHRLLRGPIYTPDQVRIEPGAALTLDGVTVTRFPDDLPHDEAGLRQRIAAALAPR